MSPVERSRSATAIDLHRLNCATVTCEVASGTICVDALEGANVSEFVKWFFDGFGTFLVGLLVGGAGVAGLFLVVKKTRVRQSQKAGDNARQIQINQGGNIQ